MITIADVMRKCNNFFVYAHEAGDFAIVDGAITLPERKPGQYYMISGSIFNDGVHDSCEGLTDEKFYGVIKYLAIPQDFLNLVYEVQMWEQKYGAVADSPYKSESFGGYTYTKDDSSGGALAWYDIPSIKCRLAHWRKP